MDISKRIASQLLQIKAIQLNPRNPFTWASGLKSPIYCDNRLSLSYPHVRQEICQGFVTLSHQFDRFEVVAGVATAGIAHGVLLAEALGLPFAYVRSAAKKHGRRNRIEGRIESGQRVIVVEDLISTGGSSLDAIRALRDAGAEVVGLLAIFTYEMSFAAERFSSEEVVVSTLTSYSSLLPVAKEQAYINAADLATLREWRDAPAKWQPNPK